MDGLEQKRTHWNRNGRIGTEVDAKANESLFSLIYYGTVQNDNVARPFSLIMCCMAALFNNKLFVLTWW